jgi:hypothetical protein
MTPEQEAALARVRAKSSDSASLSPEQQAAIQRVRMETGGQSAAIQPGQAPTQNIRLLLRGLSLNNADEWEAKLRSLAGEDEQTALQDIRTKMADFESMNQKTAFAEELIGGALPAIGAVAATKNPATVVPVTARLFPNIAKVMGLGAAEGAVNAYGASEGRTFEEKTVKPSDIAMGAATNAVVSGGMLPALVGVGKMVGAGSDLVSRAVGTKAKDMVSDEVRRIVKQSGLSMDEIVDKIEKGEILAENPTIRGDVRAMRSKGGEAAKIIQEVMTERPNKTALAAGQKISSGLGAGMDQNVVKISRMQDDELKKLERIEYRDVFKNKEIANGSVNNAMMDVIKRAPNAGKKLQDAFRSATGEEPFFTVKNGKVEFIRNPTLEDAEYLRRSVNELAQEGIEKGGADGLIGSNLLNAEGDLRSAINGQSKKLEAVRENASIRREISDAFKSGESILLKTPDAAELEIAAMSKRGEMVFDSYKLGYLAKIRSSMAQGNRKSLMGRLNDESSKEGKVFRAIFPGDELDNALEKIGIAARSRDAATRILGGSDTAETLARGQLAGSGISISEVANAAKLEPAALFRVAAKMVKQFSPELSEQQKAKIARVLVSEDPRFVAKALTDKSTLGSLKAKIDNLTAQPMLAATLAASTPASERLTRKGK